ncbi:hypothetical protein D5R81_15275 [Parashewanella spongiae]|uniref:Uncharacterized protein n=1 Tax=Parashewanella spongiae TaxID=342950 RepID=A0A3A6T7L9_9GAMM|nr:hypothetical protein [Parashewanella spongiae]MCL1079394.1 hypothetical protein [Parashewanella spongiae]RJY07692.1 hypothetical protein D5R81_15275 [Parashewanella spongiae]
MATSASNTNVTVNATYDRAMQTLEFKNKAELAAIKTLPLDEQSKAKCTLRVTFTDESKYQQYTISMKKHGRNYLDTARKRDTKTETTLIFGKFFSQLNSYKAPKPQTTKTHRTASNSNYNGSQGVLEKSETEPSTTQALYPSYIPLSSNSLESSQKHSIGLKEAVMSYSSVASAQPKKQLVSPQPEFNYQAAHRFLCEHLAVELKEYSLEEFKSAVDENPSWKPLLSTVDTTKCEHIKQSIAVYLHKHKPISDEPVPDFDYDKAFEFAQTLDYGFKDWANKETFKTIMDEHPQWKAAFHHNRGCDDIKEAFFEKMLNSSITDISEKIGDVKP